MNSRDYIFNFFQDSRLRLMAVLVACIGILVGLLLAAHNDNQHLKNQLSRYQNETLETKTLETSAGTLPQLSANNADARIERCQPGIAGSVSPSAEQIVQEDRNDSIDDSIRLESASIESLQEEFKQDAINFISQTGFEFDLEDGDTEAVKAALHDVFHNASYDKLATKLQSTLHLAKLATNELEIDQSIIQPLLSRALTNDENAEQIMNVVYKVGGHSEHLDKLVQLAGGNNSNVSKLATKTLIDIVIDHSSDNEGNVTPPHFQEAKHTMVEKIIEDPSLIIEMK